MGSLHSTLLLPLAFVVVFLHVAPLAAEDRTTEQARKFVTDHEKRLKKLDIDSSLAWWEASTTGSKEAFQKKIDAQNKIDAALGDAKVFTELKGLKEKR